MPIAGGGALGDWASKKCFQNGVGSNAGMVYIIKFDTNFEG